MKIKNHVESKAHEIAEIISSTKNENIIKTAIAKVATASDAATEAIFRTAYYIGKSNRPNSDHSDLIELHKLNGVNVGIILHSRYSATSIINHIANEMRKQIVLHIVSSSSKIAVLIDEATIQSKTSVTTVHLKADFGNGEPILFFLDLVELPNQSVEGVTKRY